MRSIDIHAHLTPMLLADHRGSGDWHTVRREQDARGRQYAVGGRRQELPPRARWTPEERLADMDSLGVDIHVVSPYSGFITTIWTRPLPSQRPTMPIMRFGT